MKKQKRLFNDMLRRYNKYHRKLTRLKITGRNEHRQGVLHLHIQRLCKKLEAMYIGIKGVAAMTAISGMCLIAAPQANAQISFGPNQQNPFSLANNGFFSNPSFVDLDADGDLDIMSGNFYGNFKYFENTGTPSSPDYGMAQNNPFLLSNIGYYSSPTFADLDGDGDLDLMSGDFSGKFKYFENIGTTQLPAFGTVQDNPFGLTDVGDYSNISFVDLDGDTDLDMVVGELTGNFKYFQNTGSTSVPAFASVQNNPFSLIGVGNRSAPCFVDLDGDGDLDLLSGNNDGVFNYFQNTGSSALPVFAPPTSSALSLLDIGWSSTTSLADLDGDGDLDLISGESNGSFMFFENITPVPFTPAFSSAQLNPFSLTVIGNLTAPTLGDLDNDGDLDLLASETFGNFKYFENMGTNSAPVFSLVQTNPFDLAQFGYNSTPSFGDLDGDGDLDVMTGNNDGNFFYFQNTGTPSSPSFAAAQQNPFFLTDSGINSTMTFVDLDNDGDLDIMTGDFLGTFSYFENSGSNINPAFLAAQPSPFGLTDIGYSSAPAFADLDYDGDLDLLSGGNFGNFYYFENTGSDSSPAFGIVDVNPFTDNIGELSNPTFADLDGDGDSDLIVGEKYAGFYYFKNNTPGPIVPSFDIAQQNPFGLTKQYNYSVPSFVDLDNDGDLDVMARNSSADFVYFQNTGTDITPAFSTAQTNPFGLNVGGRSCSFADMDNDGDLDLMTGDFSGNFSYYENTGSAISPAFATIQTNPFALSGPGDYSNIAFVDLDNDGDLDIMSGNSSGAFKYYENIGSANAASFGILQQNPFSLISIGSYSAPSFGDLDKDGDLDMLAGDYSGIFSYFENTGTAGAPAFAAVQQNPYSLAAVGTYAVPSLADLDNDGDLDLLAGDYNGNFSYFENTSLPIDFTWNGATDSDWNTASNWDGDVLPTDSDNVVIPDVVNDPVITADVAVNDIEVQTNASLTITSNSLTVNGELALEGSTNVASGASLLPLGSIIGAGSATIHRNTTFGIEDGKYSVIGSPVTTGSTSSLGNIVYSYDETIAYDPLGTAGSARFVAVVAPEAMAVGDAYFSANTGAISFVGIPNSGNVDVSLVYNLEQDGAGAGFNLVSNPYTAAISYTDLMAGNADIDGTLYIWDDGGSNVAQGTNSDYITATGMGSTGPGGNARVGNWDGYIRSAQGFFVKANTTPATLHFTASMMATSNNTDGGFFREEKPTVLRFVMSSDNLYNDILIGFKEDATADFDRTLDAYKVKGNKDLQLYSRMSEHIMAIQALPELTDEMTVDLGFDVADAGTYTFELKDADQYGFGVYLKDHQLGKLIDLYENNSYTFNSEAVQNSNRFSLIFSPNAVLAIGDETITNEMIVFSNASGLNVRMTDKLKNATVKIYNFSGTLVKEVKQIDFTGADWNTSFNQKGLFILTVQSEGQLYVKKFLK